MGSHHAVEQFEGTRPMRQLRNRRGTGGATYSGNAAADHLKCLAAGWGWKEKARLRDNHTTDNHQKLGNQERPSGLTHVKKGKSEKSQRSSRPSSLAGMPSQIDWLTCGVEHLRGANESNWERGTGF